MQPSDDEGCMAINIFVLNSRAVGVNATPVARAMIPKPSVTPGVQWWSAPLGRSWSARISMGVEGLHLHVSTLHPRTSSVTLGCGVIARAIGVTCVFQLCACTYFHVCMHVCVHIHVFFFTLSH